MSVGLLLIVLVLGLVLVGSAAAVLVVLRFSRGGSTDASDSGTCAACGYAVRGIGELTCPECGADLRMVGITAPSHQGRSTGLVALVVGAVVAMVLVLMLVVGLLYLRASVPVSAPAPPPPAATTPSP